MLNIFYAIGVLLPQPVDPWVIANGRQAVGLTMAITLALVGYLIDRSGAKSLSSLQSRR
jgi:hypothetical protein